MCAVSKTSFVCNMPRIKRIFKSLRYNGNSAHARCCSLPLKSTNLPTPIVRQSLSRIHPVDAIDPPSTCVICLTCQLFEQLDLLLRQFIRIVLCCTISRHQNRHTRTLNHIMRFFQLSSQRHIILSYITKYIIIALTEPIISLRIRRTIRPIRPILPVRPLLLLYVFLPNILSLLSILRGILSLVRSSLRVLRSYLRLLRLLRLLKVLRDSLKVLRGYLSDFAMGR